MTSVSNNVLSTQGHYSLHRQIEVGWSSMWKLWYPPSTSSGKMRITCPWQSYIQRSNVKLNNKVDLLCHFVQHDFKIFINFLSAERGQLLSKHITYLWQLILRCHQVNNSRNSNYLSCLTLFSQAINSLSRCANLRLLTSCALLNLSFPNDQPLNTNKLVTVRDLHDRSEWWLFLGGDVWSTDFRG